MGDYVNFGSLLFSEGFRLGPGDQIVIELTLTLDDPNLPNIVIEKPKPVKVNWRRDGL